MQLELDQIQGTVLRPRPTPYVGAYLLYRIDDPAQARLMLRRLVPHVTTAADWQEPEDAAWLNIAFSHPGLRALGLSRQVLDGFPQEFREPMRACEAQLGDLGEGDPTNGKLPERARFDIGLLLIAPDRATFEAKLAIGHTARQKLAGVTPVSRLDIRAPESGRDHLGLVDRASRPFVSGESGRPRAGQVRARAGEFLLGYVDELGRIATGPGPERLWRNGTYLSIRKLHQKVALFQRFRKENEDVYGEELPGARLTGCPHMLLCRRAVYGPALPAGVLDDDGIARGVVLECVNADPGRQFDFSPHEWIFDPGLPAFVVSKGSEQVFLPGISGLRYLAGAMPD
ncbi:hypothetical protein ACL02O_20665 [Micromonospora sp. MS34]|uniref:hypothetical protein n=1 Tax=Micromonospora sp. MS34 TaxID=3385971 RepID=UPI0039A2F019